MSTTEIKTALHQLVDEMSSEKKLTAMMPSATEIAFDISEVNVETLTAAQKKSIAKGLDDAKNGRFISHNEVMKKYKE
jgi:predicted transcriptional regulator